MSPSPESLCSAGLDLLLFSLSGVYFGVDVEQIGGISTHDGKETEDVFRLPEALGMGGKKIHYGAPIVLTIRTEDSRKARVIIDAPEDLIHVQIDEIRPFPRIMVPFTQPRGLWAVTLRGEKKILLMDFLYLLRQRSDIKNPER
jgi:chemotaxis signal transduction protein